MYMRAFSISHMNRFLPLTPTCCTRTCRV